MWCAKREMHSQGKDMEEDRMEAEKDKSREEQEITAENIKGQVYLAKIKRVHRETQMQWILTEGERRKNMLSLWEVWPYDQKLLGEK